MIERVIENERERERERVKYTDRQLENDKKKGIGWLNERKK